MSILLETVASNCVFAAALAAIVSVISKWRMNPTLVHFLLLLVLIKLFMPPVVSVGVPRFEAKESSEIIHVGNALLPPGPISTAHHRRNVILENWRAVLVAAWTAGIVVILGTTLVRIVAFQTLFRHVGDAPPFLKDMTKTLCRKMGIRNTPEILVLPARISPAVWSLAGRPRILLPQELVACMRCERLETIIAHELAHVRRRDHFIRFLEFAAITVFWWNPMVWWVRRQLRELEEQCCDAIVVETVTDSVRDYAVALVETLEFLSKDSGPLPVGATAAKPGVSLSRRIEMLKTGSNARQLTRRGMLMAFCLLAVPMGLVFAEESPESSDMTTKVYDLGLLTSAAEQVEQQIVQEIEPKQWKRSGGPFAIRRTTAGQLVVTAKGVVHDQISTTLEIRVIERRKRELTQKLGRIRGNKDGNTESDSALGAVPILDPVSGEIAPLLCTDPPSRDEVLRSLPNEAGAKSFLADVSRDNVRIVIEPIIAKREECRFYPLVGPARLHKCRYKCTVYCDKTIRSDWPVPFSHTDQIKEVVYIDRNRLIRCAGPDSE